MCVHAHFSIIPLAQSHPFTNTQITTPYTLMNTHWEHPHSHISLADDQLPDNVVFFSLASVSSLSGQQKLVSSQCVCVCVWGGGGGGGGGGGVEDGMVDTTR